MQYLSKRQSHHYFRLSRLRKKQKQLDYKRRNTGKPNASSI